MIEFDSFCYLQNQKTGCSMVETFLRKHCSEDIVRYEKHRAPKLRKTGKLYFISVREPLDTYLSLFNYGLDGKGELFERLTAAGAAGLYSQGINGFGAWLNFVLDPGHAALVYPKGCSAVAFQLGLVSFRFLRLAALGFEQQCGALADRAAIIDFFESSRLVDEVICYESLQQDLLALVEGPLRHAFADLPAALNWIAASPRVNASTRRDRTDKPLLTDTLRERLVEREWFLYQTHYANMAGKITS
jgi:hypothetical protein